MKILPITNNNSQYKNITHKGHVGEKTTFMLNDMTERLTKIAASFEDNSLKKAASSLAERTKHILENMNTLMLNFGKTCVLDYIPNTKKPSNSIFRDTLFVITSKDSDYAQVVGNASLYDNICAGNILDLEKLVKKLLKLSPDETNVKFRVMKNPNMYDYKTDNFAPETRIWYVEDKLVFPDSSNFSQAEGIVIAAARDVQRSAKKESQ